MTHLYGLKDLQQLRRYTAVCFLVEDRQSQSKKRNGNQPRQASGAVPYTSWRPRCVRRNAPWLTTESPGHIAEYLPYQRQLTRPGALPREWTQVHQGGTSGAIRVGRRVGLAGAEHDATHRWSAMSDTADRLAQVVRDMINEAVQEAVR